jgi:CRISPR-associated protein Csb1
LVSEMVGNHAQMGCKTSSRIDPLQILVQAGPLYKAKDGGWTLGEEDAIQEKKAAVKFGKEGKPSEANHGNVTPSIEDGGCTISEAIQTTVLSLAALRRLRFPVNGKSDPAMDDAARLVLASLGLCAATLARDAGCDLRSRCLLHPTEKTAWELLDGPGEPKTKFVLSSKDAAALVAEAVSAAKKVGLPWREDGLSLVPSPQLVALVRRSVELAAQTSADNGED